MKDVVGKKFNRLTVLGIELVRGRRFANCECECGSIKRIALRHVVSGSIKSCGCLRSEKNAERCTKHGLTPRSGCHPIYNAWRAMISRCTNPNDKCYHLYGGRGIKVCDRWRVFSNFVHDMISGWEEGLTIERINPNGNYEPSNCRWATWSEQARNKRTSKRILFHGKPTPLADVAEAIGMNYDTLHHRIFDLGWTVESSIGQPVI